MIAIKAKLSGRFALYVSKADKDGSPIIDTRRKAAEFDNLILNQGLNQYGTLGTFLEACQVGTGSAAVQATDTGLSNRIAGTTNKTSTTRGSQGGEPYYTWIRINYMFSVGAAAGVIAEIGVGTAGTGSTLFSRALIEDGGGNPTTITVKSDEILEVVYELRYYPPLVDASGTVTLGGNDYGWTSRASNVTSNSTSSGWYIPKDATIGGPTGVRAFDGAIGDITGSPSGSASNRSSSSDANYTNGNYYRDATATWGVSSGNFGTGIKSMVFKHGMGNYQIEFDPAIPKQNTEELAITVRHSWDRA